VSFRIPTPTFGSGLIEQIPDWAIVANRNANASSRRRSVSPAAPEPKR